MSDYIGRPCGSVCGIPEDAHQTEEHPWVAAREPAGAGLREAANYAARVLDLWLTGNDDFTEQAVRDAITNVRAALAASPTAPPPTYIEVERLSKPLRARLSDPKP